MEATWGRHAALEPHGLEAMSVDIFPQCSRVAGSINTPDMATHDVGGESHVFREVHETVPAGVRVEISFSNVGIKAFILV